MALPICGIYLVFGSLWILFSDIMLDMFARNTPLLTQLQTLKGWFFILFTTGLLYLLLSRHNKQTAKNEKLLLSGNSDLTAAYEELAAMEEELRQQCIDLLESDKKLRHQNDYLHLLHEISLSLMGQLRVEEVLTAIVNKASLLGNSQHGYLYLLTADEQWQELRIRTGLALREIGDLQAKGEGLVGTVWETGQPLVIHDYSQWANRLSYTTYDTVQTSLGIPIKSNDKVIGVFGLNYTEKTTVTETDLTFLQSLAELAALAITNAVLHQSLQQELQERQKAEHALRTSESQMRALIEAYPDFITRLDGMGTVMWFQPARDFTLALSNKEVIIGRNIGEFLTDDLADRVLYHVEEAWRTRTNQSFEYEIVVNGSVYYREMRLVSCCNQDILCVLRDITTRKNMEHQLRYMGLHDSITGLYNRLYFEEEMHRLEDDRHLPVGLIVCDLDGLKLINDTFGHTKGDDLLKASATVIRNCFRTSDVVSRIGGDEFAILMPHTDYEITAQSCKRLKQAVNDYNATSPLVPISISIGMAVKENSDRSMTAVFKEADNNMYREKLHHSQSNRSAVVQTLAMALEARDFVTDGHADRLQDIVEAMGRALNLEDNVIGDLRLLGRFHDIGKVGIPDSILFKPGKLTDEEYTIMQRHSEIGYRIAQSSTDLSPIGDWILKHHERWDGKGYPLNLSGNDIPLACRLLAIADAYDAMTNDRPYRQAMSPSEAADELKRCSGTQFDPALIDLFEKVIDIHG